MQSKLNIQEIDVFIFDFDGVLTDNRVLVDGDGREHVACNRSDGLAFDVLRKLKKKTYILSTESNPVVVARAKKLKIPVVQGVKDKLSTLRKLADEKSFELGRVLYVGNDVNDYKAMKACGYSACPSDSHESIKSIASIILCSAGGNAVVRELVEKILNLDFLQILYAD